MIEVVLPGLTTGTSQARQEPEMPSVLRIQNLKR